MPTFGQTSQLPGVKICILRVKKLMKNSNHRFWFVISVMTALCVGGCSFEPEIVESRTMTCKKYKTKLQWNEWSDGKITVNWQNPKRPGQWEPFEGLPYQSSDRSHEQIVECVATGNFQYFCYYQWTTNEISLEHTIDWMTQQMIFDWNSHPTEIVQCY